MSNRKSGRNAARGEAPPSVAQRSASASRRGRGRVQPLQRIERTGVVNSLESDRAQINEMDVNSLKEIFDKNKDILTRWAEEAKTGTVEAATSSASENTSLPSFASASKTHTEVLLRQSALQGLKLPFLKETSQIEEIEAFAESYRAYVRQSDRLRLSGAAGVLQPIQSCIDQYFLQKLKREPEVKQRRLDLNTCDAESLIKYLLESRTPPEKEFVDMGSLPRIELDHSIVSPNNCIGDWVYRIELHLKSIGGR